MTMSKQQEQVENTEQYTEQKCQNLTYILFGTFGIANTQILKKMCIQDWVAFKSQPY